MQIISEYRPEGFRRWNGYGETYNAACWAVDQPVRFDEMGKPIVFKELDKFVLPTLAMYVNDTRVDVYQYNNHESNYVCYCRTHHTGCLCLTTAKRRYNKRLDEQRKRRP